MQGMVEDGTLDKLPPMIVDFAKIYDIDTCMYEDFQVQQHWQTTVYKKFPLFLDHPQGEYQHNIGLFMNKTTSYEAT